MPENTPESNKLSAESLYTGFKVLIRYLSAYKKTIAALTVMGILSALGNGIVPYITGRFFDSIRSDSIISVAGFAMPLFIGLLILWSFVQLITYIIDWQSNTKSEYLSNVIWLDYLSAGFGYLLELPISFHKKNKIGDIGNKINIAGNALETIAGRIIIDLSPQVLSIVIAIIVAFIVKAILAVILVLGVASYLGILIYKLRPLARFQKEYWEGVHTYFGDAYDAIGNTIAIKQATSEKTEQAKFDAQTKKIVPSWMRMTMVWSGLSFYQRMVILATQVAIFVISVYYIRAGSMTLGELLAFNAYAAMVFGPFVTIARNWQTIQNGLINIEETEKILELEPENYHPENGVHFDIKGSISFKDVSFHYEAEKSVLEHITFDAKPGEVIALVGESGVGKSTLIDLISAYHFPESGEVTIDGHDVRTIDLHDLRSHIAVVPQEVVLFNDTIEMNIRYGNLKATDNDMRIAAQKAHALDFIEKFPDKWQQIVGERGIKLSVGQKQRVAIARAILRDPAILILDEPTSALDASSEHLITKSLEELMRGKTTFIIAHRLSTVRRANKILVLKNGTIVESGTHDELVHKEGGEYKRLHDLQMVKS